MKILDRYIGAAVALAFLSGVTMFMVLLCAMNLLKDLIKLITQDGFPTGTALLVSAYRIPGLLLYAFPMAVLLGILLTFGRMSGESEMVAIRAAGVSFFRIMVPAMIIALLVTGLTFYISNSFGPYASKRSSAIAQAEYVKLQAKHSLPSLPLIKVRGKDSKLKYSIAAETIDVRGTSGTMKEVNIIYYQNDIPARFIYAPTAIWDPNAGTWRCTGQWFINTLGPDTLKSLVMFPSNNAATFYVSTKDLQVAKSPEDLFNPKRNPDDMTSAELRKQLEKSQREDARPDEVRHNVGRWATRLAQRYATPFTCLVFALIGAPLGLRHHRTSSAVGLGVSLLIIFIYYFISVYLSTFGDSGTISPLIAAWSPLVLGGTLGIILTARANQ